MICLAIVVIFAVQMYNFHSFSAFAWNNKKSILENLSSSPKLAITLKDHTHTVPSAPPSLILYEKGIRIKVSIFACERIHSAHLHVKTDL